MVKYLLKIYWVIIFCLVLILPAFGRGLGIGRVLDYPAEPRLLYPISDRVILTGKDFLEFKWRISAYINIDYYDFRLYKGYDTYAANLIFKQRLPFSEFSLKIKAELFENNQVYTWTLRQVTHAGEKSNPAFNSFRVIK